MSAVLDTGSAQLRRWRVQHRDGLVTYVGAGRGWVSVTDARPGALVSYTGRIMQQPALLPGFSRARPELADVLEDAADVAWPATALAALEGL